MHDEPGVGAIRAGIAIRRRIQMVAFAAVVAASTAACGQPVAISFDSTQPSATSNPTLTTNSNLRPCVTIRSSRCAPVGTTAGARIESVICHRTGSWATGEFRTNRWLLVQLDDGREGYVHGSHVINVEATPECESLYPSTL